MADGQNTAAVLGLIKGVAPTIATALGGPLAGAAVGFLASKLGLQEHTVEAVSNAIAGMSGTDLVKLKELELDFQKFCKDNDIKVDLAQVELNTQEAKSQFLFVAGWRPYIGWICGTGLGYQFLLRPVLNGLCALFGGDVNTFPPLEIQDLIAIVSSMLGQSYLRSKDKWNGVGNGN